MARILIVGCGCRGRALAAQLVTEGHAVRGTTRSQANFAAISASGAEPVIADPDRIATLMDSLYGVTVVCWLLASAQGEAQVVSELHSGRLRMLCEKLVDSGVRGLVYEAAGTLPSVQLENGADIVAHASSTWHIPVEVVRAPPANFEAWRAEMVQAVNKVLNST